MRSLIRSSSVLVLLLASISSVHASAHVRVAHLSPDAPNVDVYVGGERVLRDVPFGTVSPYLPLPAGTYSVQVTPVDADLPVVIDTTVTVATGEAYTVAAVNTLDAISALVRVDDSSPDATQARVRFTHASPDAPPVDVAITAGPTLFPNFSFTQSSAYEPVAAGTYDLEVRLAGQPTVVLPLPGTELRAGVNYDVFAIGQVSDTTLTALLVETAVAAPARVRVAHLSPDAPNVDVRVDGVDVLTNVPYLTISDYLQLPAGTYDVEVRPAGLAAPVVIDETVSVLSGTSYTVAATGLLAGIEATIQVDDRSSSPVDAEVRFAHASPDAPPVDVALAGGAVLFPDRSFRESSMYMPIAPGTYDLEVRLAGTSTVVLPLPNVTLEAGVNLTVYATGLVADSTLGALVSVNVADRFIRGDSDRSGSIDLIDPVRTLRYLFVGDDLEFCPDAGDFDDNGHLDVSDVIGSLGFIFLGGAAPAAPFPSIGTDATADDLRCEIR